MVYLSSAESCDCNTCDGGTPAPSGHFGGSMCICQCHTLKGKKKEAYIKEKNNLVRKTSIPSIRAKDINIDN
jgi:hypothetical protein